MLHAKRILFVLSSAPYSTSLCQTALDNIFAHASLECQCTLVFTDSGTQQLIPDASEVTSRSISKQLSALPLYDIDEVYVRGDIPQRSILKEQLISIDFQQMHQLIQSSDIIYHY